MISAAITMVQIAPIGLCVHKIMHMTPIHVFYIATNYCMNSITIKVSWDKHGTQWWHILFRLYFAVVMLHIYVISYNTINIMLVILWYVQFKLERLSFLIFKTTLNSEVSYLNVFICM